MCVPTKCVLGLLMIPLVSSCGKSSMPAATESAGLRIESELFAGCDRDGESVVQVDLKFVNVSQRPLEIYFPPNWGLYGGLRFVAYDQEQEPLKLRNLLHGIPLPISDDDYRKVTWHIPKGGHVLLTKVERIDEEFSKSDSLAYANVEYFSPLPADLFKSQALFWRGKRIASELRPIKAKSCNESPAPN